MGQRGYRRWLVAGSTGLSTGQLLYALEVGRNDGPWVVPEGLRRTHAVVRYSVAEGPTHWSITGMGYESRWTATDQIPRRAVEAGLIDRFGTIDPSDGGSTGRAALSWNWQRKANDGGWRASAYVVRSLILGRGQRKTEAFLNAGWGFHSNDARGVVARIAPRELSPVDPVTPLARTRGAEVGLLEFSSTEWKGGGL